jgi:hypothetical protein
MRRLALAFVVLASSSVAALVACSSDTTTSSNTDAGTIKPDSGGTDSGGGGDSGGGSDAGSDAPAALNGCTGFLDRTAPSAARDITWSLAVGTDPTRCMRIKAGQSVTWTGSFVSHPLAAQGGATPNPITSSGDDGGGSVTIAFPTAGDYGYVCTIHASMTGVIKVEP